jgi:3-oxoacyl-[acyl-carrier protein] reductase
LSGRALHVLTTTAAAGLTKALARDLGARGIRINNVQPDPTETHMNPPGALPIKHGNTCAATHALVEEVADGVAYLASSGASFITGASLAIACG